MPTYSGLHITRPGQLGSGFTNDDGLGLFQKDVFYSITNCVIDMSQADCDEAVAVTYGASAVFTDCRIRGAGKLVLCGSGDDDKRLVEANRRVVFNHCLLEDFGRRGPEVQSGMVVEMNECVIRNWASDDYFDTRGFAAWAHHGGLIIARHCVFWQDRISRSFANTFTDIANHIGQSVNDRGLGSLLDKKSYIPGACRGLVATDGGRVEAYACYKNTSLIYTDAYVCVSKSGCEALIKTFKV